MSAIDQNVADQPNKASNGTLNPTDYEYIQESNEVVPEGSEYTVPVGGLVDQSYMPSYYAQSYVTYPPQPTNADVAWSTSADQAAYYTTGYLSPSAGVYDYTAQTGYGWVPSAGDYSWGIGLGDGSAVYAPDGYYSAVDPYVNGELDNSAGDAQIATLEQSVKMMGLNENGFSDGLNNAQLCDMSSQPNSWPLVSGMPAAGAYKTKRVAVNLGQPMIDSSAWNGGALRYQAGPVNMPYRSGVATKKSTSDPSLVAANSLVEKLHAEHQYNPKEFDLSPENARYFVIKSYSEDDIHRSIKYGIWCSTDYGNKRLDAAFNELNGKGPLYLFYSVNGSGHFCGIAEMCSAVDYHSSARVWAQDKWKGQFKVRWIYVKDVPNSQLRHIRLENNEGKPVTNSRDTQEVPPDKGKLVLNIIHNYRSTTSIFDDFMHYEKRQEECDAEQPAAPVGTEGQRS